MYKNRTVPFIWITMNNVSETTSIWQASWNCSSLNVGEYNLILRAKGTGAEYVYDTITVSIDSSLCAFKSPNGWQCVKETFDLETEIYEDAFNNIGVASVEYSYATEFTDSTRNWIPIDSAVSNPTSRFVEIPFNSKEKGINYAWTLFKVKVNFADGSFSEAFSDTTILVDNKIPTVPTGLEARSIGDGKIELEWNLSDDETLLGYYIYREMEGNPTDAKIENVIKDTTFVDWNTKSDSTYLYMVKAYDKAGNESEYCNFVTATPHNDPPNPVSNLTAIPHNNRIELTWQNPSDSDLAFVSIAKSDRELDTSTLNNFDNVKDYVIYAGLGTALVDNNVFSGITYYYYAFAYDSAGNCSECVMASAVPLRDPRDLVLLIQTWPGFGDPNVLADYKKEAAELLNMSAANRVDGDRVTVICYSNS